MVPLSLLGHSAVGAGALEQAAGWLRWEITVGNSDRPTLEALDERKTSLEQASDMSRLTPGGRAVYQAVTMELDDRQAQYRQAIEARDAVRARERVRGVGRGLDLGL